MKYTFGRFAFTFEKGLCTIDVLGEDGIPKYGATGEFSKSNSSAIISAVETIIDGFGADDGLGDDMAEALKVAYDNGLLDDFEPICWPTAYSAFVHKGKVMFIEPDLDHPEKPIIHDYHMNRTSRFELSAYNIWRLGLMMNPVVETARAVAESYESWENSWIDGPQG